MNMKHVGGTLDPFCVAHEHVTLITETHYHPRPYGLTVIVITISPSVAIIQNHIGHIQRAMIPQKEPALDHTGNFMVVK